MKKILQNESGFTLVEIIAVLIILGILAAVAVPRYIDLEANAKSRAIDAAVSELNGRESLSWADIKISPNGYPVANGDGTVWTKMKEPSGTSPDLGADYVWGTVSQTGANTLSFKQGAAVTLNRTASTSTQPGNWKRPLAP